MKIRHSLLIAALCAPSAVCAQDKPVEIHDRLELFVDHYLIEKLDGTALKLQEPRLAGTALTLDAPWEGAFVGYPTVIKDGDLYRLYYRGWPKTDDAEVTCYAESNDEVTWTKPKLGFVELEG